MVAVTPGVLFLTQGFLYLGAYTGILLYLNSVVASYTSFSGIPTWLLLVGIVFSIPLGTTVYIMAYNMSWARQAAAVGARLPPMATGKLPGNIDIVQMVLEKQKRGYPGK